MVMPDTKFGWRFPVAYGLSPDQMRTLGLYISEPRSAQETDRPFAEPGLFVVNPEGKVQIVEISNAPFARPDLPESYMASRLSRSATIPCAAPCRDVQGGCSSTAQPPSPQGLRLSELAGVQVTPRRRLQAGHRSCLHHRKSLSRHSRLSQERECRPWQRASTTTGIR
jgi:hypothetical protein